MAIDICRPCTVELRIIVAICPAIFALDKLHNEASRIVTGHLIPRPLCNCNVVENAEHYFFRRPKYVNERVKLFHETGDFHPLNINLILFGDVNIFGRKKYYSYDIEAVTKNKA